jgi:hypothetical protein
MIARIATFPSLPPAISAEVGGNVLDRFMPALCVQDGFVAGYWVADEGGTWILFSVWQSEADLERASQRANATPLLPGQDPRKIQSLTAVQTFPVVGSA